MIAFSGSQNEACEYQFLRSAVGGDKIVFRGQVLGRKGTEGTVGYKKLVLHAAPETSLNLSPDQIASLFQPSQSLIKNSQHIIYN